MQPTCPSTWSTLLVMLLFINFSLSRTQFLIFACPLFPLSLRFSKSLHNFSFCPNFFCCRSSSSSEFRVYNCFTVKDLSFAFISVWFDGMKMRWKCNWCGDSKNCGECSESLSVGGGTQLNSQCTQQQQQKNTFDVTWKVSCITLSVWKKTEVFSWFHRIHVVVYVAKFDEYHFENSINGCWSILKAYKPVIWRSFTDPSVIC